LIAGVTLIHLALLHKVGSNNPIGSDTGVDDLPFYPYFFYKDIFAFFVYLFFLQLLFFIFLMF
jgi:ubiquinol-cytochrome c reductase cytochrome b subunit